MARIEGSEWINLEQEPLWQGAASGMSGAAKPGAELKELQFGFPNMVLEPRGMVFAAFWCEENGIKNIRWLRLSVT